MSHKVFSLCKQLLAFFWTELNMYLRTHTHTYAVAHTQTHMHAQTRAHAICTYIHACAYITHAHRHMHTHNHIWTCMHTHTPLSRVWEEMFGFYFLMHKGPSQSDSFFTDPFCLFNCWYRLSPHESKWTHISELKFTYALGCNEELKKYRCWGSSL